MRPAVFLVATLALVGCTERLVTPGDCPALCPGGPVVVRDTILTALPGLDSAFTGYSPAPSAASLLLANGGPLGETRGLVRFIPRGDSVFAGDSLKPFTTDSVVLSLFLTGPRLTTLPVEIYRYVEFRTDPQIAALSVVLILITVGLVVLIERSVGVMRALGK